MVATPTRDDVLTALSRVNDPEIHRPITELNMVEDVEIAASGTVTVHLLLTIAGCPLKDTLRRDIAAALAEVSGITSVTTEMGVMSDEQRQALQEKLRGGKPVRQIPFAQPDSRTQVYAVASGKGGVGKSSVTVNLAASLAAQGVRVGVLDADVYGFSVPRMLGVENKPTKVENMIMPPSAHGVSVISIGMFVEGNSAVVWRGPMLHRALEQFLADVYWGDLDVLLLDLPPGTGDVAISLAQMLPTARVLVVTTPQMAAAEVAERAGSISAQTHQRIAGVIENMSHLQLPDGDTLNVFGSGGGQRVAETLSRELKQDVPLLGQVPLDPRVVEAGDTGTPLVLSHPDTPTAKALQHVSEHLASQRESIIGRPLSLAVS